MLPDYAGKNVKDSNTPFITTCDAALQMVAEKDGVAHVHTGVFAMGFPADALYTKKMRAEANMTELDQAGDIGQQILQNRGIQDIGKSECHWKHAPYIQAWSKKPFANRRWTEKAEMCMIDS